MDSSRVREALSKSGKFSIAIGRVTITIEDRDGDYEISVSDKKAEPSQWLYRSRTVAIDRFEEQVSHYRRKK